jgi:hypothetical protein
MIRYRPDLIDQLDPVSESGLAPRRAVHVPAFVTGHHQQQRSGRLQGQFVHTPGPGSSPQRGESRLDDVLGGRPRRRTAEREVVDRVTVPVEEIGQGMLIGGSEPVPQVRSLPTARLCPTLGPTLGPTFCTPSVAVRVLISGRVRLLDLWFGYPLSSSGSGRSCGTCADDTALVRRT